MSAVSEVPQGASPLIRAMKSSDLDGVAMIEKASFPHPWTRDQFLSELSRETISRCYVALGERGETNTARHTAFKEVPVEGFIMAWLVSDELHITNLAVAPEARRRGIAAALLNHAIREAVVEGAVWCQLDVRVSNKPARNLYSRFGFTPLGTRKGYYLNGEDAVVMGKDLSALS